MIRDKVEISPEVDEAGHPIYVVDGILKFDSEAEAVSIIRRMGCEPVLVEAAV